MIELGGTLQSKRFCWESREDLENEIVVGTRLEWFRIPHSVQKLGGDDHSPKSGVSCCEHCAFVIRHSLLLPRMPVFVMVLCGAFSILIFQIML